MEPSVDINVLFPERVSVLDHSLVSGCRTAGRPDLQAHIASVIDELGKASARAQQLTAPITSASKLQSQRHQLYLLKEGESSGGRGMAVGFLKVGYKKLFLLNRQGVHVEAEPLCVLDFYVAENLQRHGYGLELFEFMLQHKNVEPVLMAYDRPSPKFLSFLAKHYCLTESVPQVNNFVVFEGFFLNRAAAQLRKVPQRKAEGEIKPYSVMEREAFRREQRTLPWPFAPPHSPQRSVSSQYSQSLSVGSSPTRTPPRVEAPSFPGGSRDPCLPSILMERSRARRSSRKGQSARCSLFTHYMDTSTVEQTEKHLLGSSERQLNSPALLPPLHPRVSAHCALASVRAAGLTDAVRSLPLRLPPLPQMGASAIQTSLDRSDQPLEPGCKEKMKLWPKALLEGSAGWSWTVGGSCASAQRVRQRQQYRSTQPW